MHICTTALRSSTYRLVQLSRSFDCKVITGKRSNQMTTRAASPKQAPPTQIENELIKGLRCAAQSHTALDQQERLALLAETENAYQNVLCLVMKAVKRTGSPIAKKLRQLRKFINEKQHTSKRKCSDDTLLCCQYTLGHPQRRAPGTGKKSKTKTTRGRKKSSSNHPP